MLFAKAIGVPLQELQSVVVVGSKGKATAATVASAALAGAGLRVGTITSPPIITNRERIRIDGVAVDELAYWTISEAAAAARQMLAPATAESGYLSPAGMYMIAGLDFLRRSGCNVFVVEAGMGGRSDEVSLLNPESVIVTTIFAEHVGILGRNLTEIAEEKLGVVTSSTRHVVSTPQSGEVRGVFERFGITATFVQNSSGGGLHRASAEAGLEAARLHVGAEDTMLSAMRRAADTVLLPGRLTSIVDRNGRHWLVDAAVHAAGVAFAVSHAQRTVGLVDRVLVSLPDSKDVARTAAWLDREVGRRTWAPVIPPGTVHLSYSNGLWGQELLSWDEAHASARSASNIVAVGSWSFMSAVLASLDVENERAFTVP